MVELPRDVTRLQLTALQALGLAKDVALEERQYERAARLRCAERAVERELWGLE